MEARHAVKEAARLTREEKKTTELSQRLEAAEAQQENINNTDNVDATNEAIGGGHGWSSRGEGLKEGPGRVAHPDNGTISI